MDLLEEIPNLLGCDMDYDSASVTMREYRSDPATYTRLTEGMRADVLEDGEMADETVMLLWLLPFAIMRGTAAVRARPAVDFLTARGVSVFAWAAV